MLLAMPAAAPKTTQLQVRVSRAQKKAIQQAAKQARMDMSAYVLARVLPAAAARFHECVRACAEHGSPSFPLAALNSFLSGLVASEMQDAVATAPSTELTPFLANYIAAMVEVGCVRCAIAPPAWIREIEPLTEPIYGTSLMSVRLYLLTHSPPAFRRRNIFIDSTLGAAV